MTKDDQQNGYYDDAGETVDFAVAYETTLPLLSPVAAAYRSCDSGGSSAVAVAAVSGRKGAAPQLTDPGSVT